MNKRNRYIIVGISVLFITLLITLYSAYTYSAMSGGNEVNLIDNTEINYDEELQQATFSGLINYISRKEQVERYESILTTGTTETLPTQYIMTNVPYNRQQVGPTCWAVSALNAIETTIANTGLDTSYGKTKRINPYHMIHALNEKIGNNNNPYGYRDEKNVSGGTPLNTLLYLTNGLGFTTSNSYFYNQSNSNSSSYSQGSLTLNSIVNSQTENYQVKNIQIIPGISTTTLDGIGISNYSSNQYITTKINDIKKLIKLGKGVTITSRSTQSSDNPCYREDVHSAYCPENLIDYVGAHMTLIVGWDDNYSKDNFTKTVGNRVNPGPPDDGAWIIRNSYSYGGYYYISYYDYTSLYNSNIVVTSVKVKDYDNVYQYNPSGCNAEYNCFELESIASDAVNIYTKKTNRIEQVKSISFYADKVNNNNKVKIYIKEGNVSTGNLSSLFSQENYVGEVSIPANGYYTYELNSSQDIKITSNKFYVGLRPIHRDTLNIQRKSNLLMSNRDVGIKEGISYYYNGSTYNDLANYDTPSTAFIKVYTKTTSEIPDSEKVNYTVKYYLEKLDGTYELKETKNLTGVIGDKAALENYDGFIKPTAIELTANTTLVEYKYKRKSYTVTLTKIKGISDVSGGGSYKHGQTVTINATVSSGYTWSRWIGETTVDTKKYTFVMPKKDIVYTAIASQENTNGIKVTGISITNCPTSSIKVGETLQLTTTITPSNATNKNVVWTVPSFDNVTITNNGKLKATKSGSVIVTAVTVEGGYQAKCNITISDEIKEDNSSSPKTSTNKVKITLDQPKVSILEGKEITLKAIVTGSTKKVIWTSSDEEIATVENGVIKAINVGTATITAKIDGTNKTAKAEITVITDKEIGVKFESKNLDIYLNREKTIKLITTPTNMVIEKIEYVLEDEELAMITNNIITGLKIGSTKLTVKVNDKYEASTMLNVHDEPIEIIISGYNLNFNEEIYQYELEIQKEKTLTITSNKDIDIKGNEKLKNGSIIKITSLETNKTYEIKIIKKDYKYIFIIIIGILLITNVIRLIIKNKKK